MGGRGTLAVVNALIHGLKVLGRSDFITGRLVAKWCRGVEIERGRVISRVSAAPDRSRSRSPAPAALLGGLGALKMDQW